MRQIIFISFFTVLAVAACGPTIDEATMSPIASSLSRVATALDAYVIDEANPPDGGGLIDEELLAAATAHDSTLLPPLEDYARRARAVGRDSSVLVCTENHDRGLIEDAGCSGKSDLPLWRIDPSAPCDFVLNLVDVCVQQ